jgi:rubrerythrin
VTLARVEIHGVTRASFLARTALAAGALYAGPVVARALGHDKHTSFGGGDVGIANFALTLEKIESEFYKQALAAEGVLGTVSRKLVEQIARHEDEHVKQLTQTIQQLGGKADPAPQVRIPRLAGEEAVLRFAIELEDTCVSAYNGAATKIQSRDVLQAIASIGQVEARHAGALRELRGEPPTDGPFDRVFSGEEADAAVHELTA